jgi:phage shock protein PspC (stress-responsive transcriptional regulator)
METKKLYRSRTNKWIAGVCGGLGEFFKIDPVFWRLIFLMGGIFACPFFFVTYIVLWIVTPKEAKVVEPVIE